VWDLATGRCPRTLTGREVGVSGDGGVAVTSAADGKAMLWDLATGRCLHTLLGESVAVNGDGTVVLTGADGTLQIWALDWDYEFPA
jgi:WD40 repeat protein